MTPAVVEEIMRRLWQHEAPLLRLLYASASPLLQPQGARHLAPLSPPPCAGHHMFFLRVLPVSPNRFRPPSKIGEDMCVGKGGFGSFWKMKGREGGKGECLTSWGGLARGLV